MAKGKLHTTPIEITSKGWRETGTASKPAPASKPRSDRPATAPQTAKELKVIGRAGER